MTKKSKKWGDLKLDAAQFATDKFFEAMDAITEEVGKIVELQRLGTATEADDARLEHLQTEWIAISREIGDIGKRLLKGGHLPPDTVN